MAEELFIPKGGSREEIYALLYPQLKALTADEPDLIANMANIASGLKEAFEFLWVGFYRVVDDRLVLGPFRDRWPVRVLLNGKGVCGTSWKEKKTLVVPDVDKFPGHIACSSLSRSEIVVPICRMGSCGQCLMWTATRRKALMKWMPTIWKRSFRC